MMRSGALADSENGRRIYIAAAKSTRVPKCAACLFEGPGIRPSVGMLPQRIIPLPSPAHVLVSKVPYVRAERPVRTRKEVSTSRKFAVHPWEQLYSRS